MNIDLEPGIYVVAVSGGVDSVVLLDLLAGVPNLKLLVAHFDHGIRPESKLDRQLAQKLARGYGLPFIYDEGRLGPGTSEEKARNARYAFLHKVRRTAGAKALITAHHQDDLIETAIINMLRGTGRKGLSSLRSQEKVIRPLLGVSKKDLIKWADAKKLNWREDSTNQDIRYLRNYVRHKVLPRFSSSDKQKLIELVKNSHNLNKEIELHLTSHLHLQPAGHILDRHFFIKLPHAVSLNFMAEWLARNKTQSVNRKLLNQIVTSAKVLKPGKQIDVDVDKIIKVSEDELALTSRER